MDDGFNPVRERLLKGMRSREGEMRFEDRGGTG